MAQTHSLLEFAAQAANSSSEWVWAMADASGMT